MSLKHPIETLLADGASRHLLDVIWSHYKGNAMKIWSEAHLYFFEKCLVDIFPAPAGLFDIKLKKKIFALKLKRKKISWSEFKIVRYENSVLIEKQYSYHRANVY